MCTEKQADQESSARSNEMPRRYVLFDLFAFLIPGFRIESIAFWGLTLCALAFGIANYVPSGDEATLAPGVWSRSGLALIVIAFGSGSTICATACIGYKWRSNRRSLNAAESYIALFAMAVLTSMTVGTINYLVYWTFPSEYAVDERVHHSIVVKFKQAFEADLLRVRGRISFCERLSEALASTVVDPIHSSKASAASSHGAVTYTFRADTGALIDLTVGAYAEPDGYVGTTGELIGKADGNVMVLNKWAETPRGLVQEPEVPLELLSLRRQLDVNPTSVPKKLLVNLLTADAELMKSGRERNAIDATVRANDILLPPSYFLFQTALQALELDIDYATPVGMTARIVALVFGISRLIYFGLFIGLLSGRKDAA